MRMQIPESERITDDNRRVAFRVSRFREASPSLERIVPKGRFASAEAMDGLACPRCF